MQPLFAFLNLWGTLAVGVGAVSIPIIIHLLNRRRFRVVVWAAMRFLLMAQKQNTRRMRLEQIILLAVRCCVILLIVLAMAAITPWAERLWAAIWPEGAAFTRHRSTRIHKIIVLDASLSMATRGEGGKTLFERGRELALQIVDDSAPGDGLSVALLKDVPVWVVGEAALDARKVRGEVEQLRQAHGNANVAAALNMVAAKLSESGNRFDAREVYFITDLQKATWLGGPAPGRKDGKPERERNVIEEIKKQAATIFVDVGRDNVTNLAVTDLTLGDTLITTGMPVPVMAHVQNFGPGDKKQVRVELLVGRARSAAADPPFALRSVAAELVDVKPGARARVAFVHKFSEPGTYALQVKVEEDELTPDDARTVVITVRETVPALLVNGKAVLDRFDRATEYLRHALNPFVKEPIPRFAPIRPEVVSVPGFRAINDNKLADYDCIYLCDVARLSKSDVDRLKIHLKRGGGLIISLGEQVGDQLQGYNRLLYDTKEGVEILPGELKAVQAAPKNHYFGLHARPDTFGLPPLKAFADEDDKISLTKPRFDRYVRVEPAADARARTVLSFTPFLQSEDKAKQVDPKVPSGDPAILEWNPPLPPEDRVKLKPEKGGTKPAVASRYRGKVILVTTTLNMDWNSWPLYPSFGAMMQELFRLAVSGRLREQAYLVGGLLEEFLPGGAGDGTLYLPGRPNDPARVRPQGAADLTVFRWADTDISGIYRLTVGRDPTEYLFAVNVPVSSSGERPGESDLTRLPKDKLEAAYPGWEFQLVTNLRDVRHADAPVSDDPETVRGALGPGIARWALLLVLVLLLAEVVLAWIFGHHTAVPGAGNPPATGLLWPGVIGAAAAGLFVFIAGSLIHAAETGDFLGYLPDGFRAWVEGLLGIPPPAPGEGTRWHLEWTPYLHSAAQDPWLATGIALLALAVVVVAYRGEAKTASVPYKCLLGGLRLFVILFTLAVLLPLLQLRFERQGWPDVVLLIDDTRSMGETDYYQDEKVQKAADTLGERIKAALLERLPGQIAALKTQRDEKEKALARSPKDAALAAEAQQLSARLQALESQRDNLGSPAWKPSRLQLAQAILGRPEPDWLNHLLTQRQLKVHVFHLDREGRAIKLKDAQGLASTLDNANDPQQLERARKGIAELTPTGNDSRLGTAVRQVLDYYRGASLTAVIALTDGVTTREETLGQVSEYAAQKGVPLFFVGIGDDHEVRDLKLHDLQVEDTVYVHDTIVFEARLTGRGYKSLTVPVVLKVREKDGKERELSRKKYAVNERGDPVKIDLRHQATEPGEKLYIIEVEMPKLEREDRMPNPADLRLQRSILVQESKLIKVLYVEGQPRYEYRFIKSLLERELPDKTGKKTMELKVVLTDADEGVPQQDKTALADFPPTKEELFQYDVVILGDVDPRSRRLGEARLRTLADFVRERGGGLLMIAGTQYSPHAYRGTPLADVLPIDMNAVAPVEPEERPEGFRPDLTPVGRRHPIFRFSANEGDNVAIWNRLAPLYWWSEGYKIKPLAEVLAAHPKKKSEDPRKKDEGHPLVVQQFVGAGRCMFMGLDETWRWRFREDEVYFNRFWIQMARYLSRNRASRTTLRLDRQTAYRVGEPIKVTVQFPDSRLVPGQDPGKKAGPKGEVSVLVEHRGPGGADGPGETEVQALQLAKVEGSFATYEGLLVRTHEGKYKFRLQTPDVSKQQPSGENPSGEAIVVPPPGELDRLRMNVEEMKHVALETGGQFYTLATADRVLEDLPEGVRISLNTPRPPQPLWNHLLAFLLVLGLFTSEWVLRKRKHLL